MFVFKYKSNCSTTNTTFSIVEQNYSVFHLILKLLLFNATFRNNNVLILLLVKNLQIYVFYNVGTKIYKSILYARRLN
jgi:hypothetical protein